VNGIVNSSPTFFRLIRRAAGAFAVIALLLAAFVRAPLQEAADPGRVPNPVKSAWFLLWVQELVSYSKFLVYPVLLLLVAFFLLPRIHGDASGENASWRWRKPMPTRIAVVAVYLLILSLTVVAAFFRGENWAFVVPF
jgi:hypothetical protein